MGSSAPASILTVLSLLVLSLISHCLTARKTNKSHIQDELAVILPLRLTHEKLSLPLSRPSNSTKLLFHHNISLTVSLSVGTPPQNVSMVLDTGSELSWLLCNSSSSFHPLSSSSFSYIPCSSPACQSYLPCSAAAYCHVSLTYADASTSDGLLAADLFPLPSHKVAAFGCITSSFSSSASDPAAVGVLGMNQGPLSFVTQTSIRRFSYCIPASADAAGVLLLGGYADPPIFLPYLNYTPLFQISLPLPYFDRVAYSVQLQGIRVAGDLLPIPKSVLVPDHTGAGQTIVDSGTQFTFLLGPAYDALKIDFLRRTKGVLRDLGEPDFVYQGAFDACFLLPAWRAAPPEGLPAVALVLPGAEVVLGGDRLLYRVAGERRGGDAVWCLTFGNADLVPIEAYVIGHHHQQDLWVEYDLDRARVGFGPVRCELASRRLGAGF